MRLEHCIRRWLGLSGHWVRSIEEKDDCLVAEIEALGPEAQEVLEKTGDAETALERLGKVY